MPKWADAAHFRGASALTSAFRGVAALAGGGGVKPEVLDYLFSGTDGSGTSQTTSGGRGMRFTMTADVRLWSHRSSIISGDYIPVMWDNNGGDTIIQKGPLVTGSSRADEWTDVYDFDSPMDLLTGNTYTLICFPQGGSMDHRYLSTMNLLNSPVPFTDIQSTRDTLGTLTIDDYSNDILTDFVYGRFDLGYELL